MSAAQDKKKKGNKKTGTLSWTEYLEGELLMKEDENQKLQLEMENLKRHYDEVGDHYEERLDFQRRCMQSSSGTHAKQLKLNSELKKENEELKKELEELKARVLTEQQLEDLQGEAYKAGRKTGYEDAESEFEPYKRQDELEEARRVIPILQKGYLEMLAEIDAYKTKIAQLELKTD